MRNVTRALVGALVASLVAAGDQRVCPDADGGRFRRRQYGGARRHEPGHHHSADKGLRARGVSPDGQGSGVDHVDRTDPHGVRGSPAYGDGDRWDHGRRVSGDVSHVHATEWILRRRARERGRGSSTSVIQRTVEGSAGVGTGRGLGGGVSRRHGPV